MPAAFSSVACVQHGHVRSRAYAHQLPSSMHRSAARLLLGLARGPFLPAMRRRVVPRGSLPALSALVCPPCARRVPPSCPLSTLSWEASVSLDTVALHQDLAKLVKFKRLSLALSRATLCRSETTGAVQPGSRLKGSRTEARRESNRLASREFKPPACGIEDDWWP